MSTTEPTQDPASAPQMAQDATEQAPAGDHPNDQDGTARAPGKFRQRLADAEAERDTLRATVETMRRAEVERLAAAADLVVPSALWAAGVSLDDLVGEDGQVDAGKVNNAVQSAVTTLGLAIRPRSPLPDMGQGARADVKPPGKDQWADLFRGNGGGSF